MKKKPFRFIPLVLLFAFAMSAMVEELRKVHGKSAREILEYIVAKADEFASGAKQHDEMTLIVVKVI